MPGLADNGGAVDEEDVLLNMLKFGAAVGVLGCALEPAGVAGAYVYQS